MRNDWRIAIVLAGGLAAAGAAAAQELWKYTDKNGKVTYSDKAPKPGETAELVKADPKANVIASPKKNESPTAGDAVNKRIADRVSKRDALREEVDQAREALAQAKKALEEGREPTPDEVQIRVGKDGQAGKNALLRKPEYYTRISALEDAVKKAEERVEEAERRFRREAP